MLKTSVISLVILLTGCTSTQLVYVPTYPNIPQELLEPCRELNTLDQGDGKTITTWMVDTISKYKECSSSKKALTDIVTFDSK